MTITPSPLGVESCVGENVCPIDLIPESFEDNDSVTVGFLEIVLEILSVNVFLEGSGVIGFIMLGIFFDSDIFIYKL
jgi:hypothetical protein